MASTIAWVFLVRVASLCFAVFGLRGVDLKLRALPPLTFNVDSALRVELALQQCESTPKCSRLSLRSHPNTLMPKREVSASSRATGVRNE